MSIEDELQDEDVSDDEAIARALKRSLLLLGLIVGPLMGFAIYVSTRGEEPIEFVAPTALPSIRAEVISEIPKIPLVNNTESSGVSFVHESGRAGEKLLPETMGSGVAVWDANGDGHLDLYLVNSTTWPWDESSSNTDSTRPSSTSRLYLGDGTGAFVDATDDSGLDVVFYGMGVAVGDIDNDGDDDLYVSAVGPNRLFRNDTTDPESPFFTDITAESGTAGGDDDWSTSCGFFDYDRDGLLDLFVGNYVTWNRDIDLAQSFTLDGQERAYGPPRAFAGSFPILFRNNGERSFEDVSEQAGIQIRSPDTGVPLAKSMGVVFADVNADDYLDVIVANDTVPNLLFENQRDGTFQEVARLTGIAFDRSGNARGAMGIDCAFLRNDDTLAIGIGNFANEPSALYMSRASKRQFIDAAMFTGFGPPSRQSLTFGMMFVDLDLDGRLDVVGANGHLEEDISRTQTTQQYKQSPQAFYNAGPDASSELVLLDETQVGASFLEPIVGRGAAYGDFDEDGDLDLIISTSHGSPRIFRNDQKTDNSFLRVRLVGTNSGRNAIGAIASLQIGDQTIRRCVSPTHSYLSQSERTLTFGVSTNAQTQIQAGKPAVLTVRWPSGDTESFSFAKIGQSVVVTQGDGN